jgi:hypothetical protein
MREVTFSYKATVTSPVPEAVFTSLAAESSSTVVETEVVDPKPIEKVESPTEVERVQLQRLEQKARKELPRKKLELKKKRTDGGGFSANSAPTRSDAETLPDGQVDVITPAKITPRARPSVVPTFVGREDILDAMRQTHFGNRKFGSDMPAITVLTGLGGSGKTQIALKFALDYEAR